MLKNELIKNNVNQIGKSFFLDRNNPYFFKNNIFKTQNTSSIFITKYIFLYLLEKSVSEIIDEIINEEKYTSTVNASNVPQFSSYFKVNEIINLLVILTEDNEYLNYTELGKYLLKKNKKDAAYTKYGENHGKLCNELQISYIENRKLIATPLAFYLFKLNEEKRKNILIKLSLKIPIIQYILIKAKSNKISILEELSTILSESTARRRASNIIFIIKELKNLINIKHEFIFENIKENVNGIKRP